MKKLARQQKHKQAGWPTWPTSASPCSAWPSDSFLSFAGGASNEGRRVITSKDMTCDGRK
jgi:hypothetical protein